MPRLPGGRYKVRTNPQTNFSSLQELAKEPIYEWDIDIPDHGCVNAWFEALPRGEIAGQILGEPAQDMWVEIRLVDKKNALIEMPGAKVTDGKFKFSFLPAGKYIIGFSISTGPSLDYPYAQLYYPNVTDRDKAATIRLREGERIDGLILPLPPRVTQSTLEGVAVWPDGRPAVNVPIQLRLPKYGWLDGNPVWTDSEGRFSIVGMEGQTYELSASVKKGIPLVNSKPIVVKLAKQNKPVRLVIEVP